MVEYIIIGAVITYMVWLGCLGIGVFDKVTDESKSNN